MRILVTGSRTLPSETRVCETLDAYTRNHPDPVVVVHGDCPTGTDQFAKHWASSTGAQQEPYPAQWTQHGRAAGPLRNQHMVDCGADLCLAFPTPDSRGTWDCIRRARAAGIPVAVIPESP